MDQQEVHSKKQPDLISGLCGNLEKTQQANAYLFSNLVHLFLYTLHLQTKKTEESVITFNKNPTLASMGSRGVVKCKI